MGKWLCLFRHGLARFGHPVIHKSPRQFEFTGVACSLDKDGDFPHPQPECFGPRLPIALSAQKAPQFGNQSDDGVGVAVENGIQNPLSFLRQFLRLVSVRYVLVNLRFCNAICSSLAHEVNTHCTNLLHN